MADIDFDRVEKLFSILEGVDRHGGPSGYKHIRKAVVEELRAVEAELAGADDEDAPVKSTVKASPRPVPPAAPAAAVHKRV